MSAVRERPILFSGPMVRAILDGSKTQTRRVINPQPDDTYLFVEDGAVRAEDPNDGQWYTVESPYGVPGDRLWVREAHGFPEANTGWRAKERARLHGAVWYRATDQWGSAMHHGELQSLHWCRRWRPSIHMPRWASRILLEVTDVRVERVQDISNDDAEAEGCTETKEVDHSLEGRPFGSGLTMGPMTVWSSASGNFARLWDSINGKRPGYSWDENPWVWAVSFRRVES